MTTLDEVRGLNYDNSHRGEHECLHVDWVIGENRTLAQNGSIRVALFPSQAAFL